MCVVSMVMDHYREQWEPRVVPLQTWPSYPLGGAGISQPANITIIQQPAISAAEIDEFRKLLDRAREYDKRNNEPDCELEEKKQAIKTIAERLGVEISFL